MRTFTKDDIATINCWLIARNLDPLKEEDIPKFGQIVPNIACGFVVMTDCSTCFLECFITNKEARIEDRSRALERIAKWGISMAISCGYKRILAISSKQSMLSLAEDLGFEFKNIKLASLDL